ncbi:unnamed protein product [Brugia timori]|uniref:Uncharacterized protein n=1 Tax=Brugia timori TaxID=42155 RepID=A0A0R3QF42_9BILA|nr:unnamed protein product [Brugia timori]
MLIGISNLNTNYKHNCLSCEQQLFIEQNHCCELLIREILII